MSTTIDLFTPIKIGSLELPNRIVMWAMTRNRVGAGNTPTALNATYYAQRASAGLIITEATHPSAMGRGYTRSPGLHTDEQVAGWRLVTDAVHARGGRIFVQLMHAGRVSHSSLLPGGALPVAPSAIKPAGEIYTADGTKQLFQTPRALRTEEISGIVAEFRDAAVRAEAAGFDGIELHAASGYLLNEFLIASTNQRNDAYGGSLENRARLLLEVIEAVSGVLGANRVGVKVTPGLTYNDIHEDNPAETYTYVARALNPLGLAFLEVGNHTRGSLIPPGTSPVDFDAVDLIRPVYTGTLIAGGGFDRDRGHSAIANGRGDLVAYGRSFLANPDLVERFAHNAPLNDWDMSTFYSSYERDDERGYTDYPTMSTIRETVGNPV